MATITNLTSGIEVTFAGAVTYIKHSNVKLLKRGTNLNIYDNSDDDGNQRGQSYITIPYSEVTSPATANINELYTAVKGYIDVSSGGGGGGSQQPFTFTAVNYTDLLTKTGMVSGDVAYVNDAQGTQWLPGTIGGNYYPNGIYLYTGGSWTSDRNAISYELHLDDVRLDALEARLQLTRAYSSTRVRTERCDWRRLRYCHRFGHRLWHRRCRLWAGRRYRRRRQLGRRVRCGKGSCCRRAGSL